MADISNYSQKTLEIKGDHDLQIKIEYYSSYQLLRENDKGVYIDYVIDSR